MRDSLSVGKRETQISEIERFSLNEINEVQVTEMYQLKFSSRFGARRTYDASGKISLLQKFTGVRHKAMRSLMLCRPSLHRMLLNTQN